MEGAGPLELSATQTNVKDFWETTVRNYVKRMNEGCDVRCYLSLKAGAGNASFLFPRCRPVPGPPFRGETLLGPGKRHRNKWGMTLVQGSICQSLLEHTKLSGKPLGYSILRAPTLQIGSTDMERTRLVKMRWMSVSVFLFFVFTKEACE